MRYSKLGSNYKTKDYYHKISEIEHLNSDFDCYVCGWCCISYRYFSMEEYRRICDLHNLQIKEITTKPQEDHIYFGLELKMNEDNSCLFMKNTHDMMDEIIAFGEVLLKKVENTPWQLSEEEFKTKLEEIINDKVIEPKIRHCSIHPDKFAACMMWPTFKVHNTIVCPLGCDSDIEPLDDHKRGPIEEAYYELRDLTNASGLAYHAMEIAGSESPLDGARNLISSMNQTVGTTSYEKSKKLVEKIITEKRVILTELEKKDALVWSSKLRYVKGTDLRWSFLGYYWLALWDKFASQGELLGVTDLEEIITQLQELIIIFDLFPGKGITID